jgi:ribonucleotide reductase alpha subunit
MIVRDLHPGMGKAVAERTVLRKKENGEWETWGEVANRVALGNALLSPFEDERASEHETLKRHIAKANVLMSGRHLQHGDETQPTRNKEVFTNCSVSSNSFTLFYLLMNGSGVGRCYDDDMMLINWDNAPNLRCVLDDSHPDFDFSAHESARDAKHKFGVGKDVLWYKLEDTREGWAKALELWENAAFEKIHKDKLLILDFSNVRARGTPIKGMQNRPASGPVPLMNAFQKAATIKGAGLPRWMQAIYIDHYFAECVLVGGARRAARMATKSWRDKTVVDFITIKRPIEYYGKEVDEIVKIRKEVKPLGFLWSSNNSITVDKEFWELLSLKKSDPQYNSSLAKHARSVFKMSTQAAYADGTGEPGFINQDRLHCSRNKIETLERGDYIGSKKYQVNEDTHIYLSRLLKAAKRKKYFMIVNPCVTGDAWIQTSEGPRQVNDLIDKPFTAIVDGRPYKATGFWKTGNKPIFKIETSRGYSLELTEDHKLLVEVDRRQKLHGGYNLDREWTELKDIKIGDKIVLNNHNGHNWDGDGSWEEGWLIGEIVGDGGHNPNSTYNSYLRFWSESRSEMSAFALNCIDKAGLKHRSDLAGNKNSINNTITCQAACLTELASKYLDNRKKVLPHIEKSSSDFCRGFIRGLFDSDGTVGKDLEKGAYVRLGQNNLDLLYTVQRMLSRLGILSTVYQFRHEEGDYPMPDGHEGTKIYRRQAMHDLHVSKDNLIKFHEIIGFTEPEKVAALDIVLESFVRGPYKERFTAEVVSITANGSKDVYDCTVDEVHAFDANGIMAHNCSEIPLAIWGGFCLIGDVVPYHCDTLDEAEEAFRATTRALIRVNLLDSIYKKETVRTNRIGVGITGIHEFAWKFFKFGFRDLIDEVKSKDFWMTLSRFKRAVQDEAEKYSKKLGVEIPHTDTTIKPAGTTSKLFGLTEGWHLPAMEFYLRWVQFSKHDPLVETYSKLGYPTRELTQYKNTIIVGFPTCPVISELGMGNKLVVASAATPEEQYKWVMLGEKYWLAGVDGDCDPLQRDSGSQISYTLKYDPAVVDYKSFARIIRDYQSKVKCCSVMPTEDTSSYEYLPEQSISLAEFNLICNGIKGKAAEEIDEVHVKCDSGACPIDFKKGKK